MLLITVLEKRHSGVLLECEKKASVTTNSP